MTDAQAAALAARKRENYGWFLEALARKLRNQGKGCKEIRAALKAQRERIVKCSP
jgi:hypothetical protein